MTRRELREHSFKVLFRADFYPVEEMDEQIERYFGAPVEDDVTPEGTTILHDSNLSEAEQAVVTEKVKKILEKLPEIDEKITGVWSSDGTCTISYEGMERKTADAYIDSLKELGYKDGFEGEDDNGLSFIKADEDGNTAWFTYSPDGTGSVMYTEAASS